MTHKLKDKIKNRPFKELMAIFDEKFGIGRLEMLLAVNWFNPLATIWLNFRSLPLSQAIKLPIWCYGRPRFYGLSGNMIIEGKVSSGMIRINRVLTGAPSNMNVQTEILNNGLIIFKGELHIGTGNKIVVGRNAKLQIGANSKIADMCNIGCFEKITFNDMTRIAHRCQIFDSNYHFIVNQEQSTIPSYKRPIVIGVGCWVCNSSSIYGGAILPDYTIVTSNSLVNKDFSQISNGCMIGGVPAKFIKKSVRRVYNIEIVKEIELFYQNHPTETYKIIRNNDIEEYSHF